MADNMDAIPAVAPAVLLKEKGVKPPLPPPPAAQQAAAERAAAERAAAAAAATSGKDKPGKAGTLVYLCECWVEGSVGICGRSKCTRRLSGSRCQAKQIAV